jgi:hypothetical protein
LLENLRASFCFVPLEVVGQKHVAGSRGTQLVTFGAHQDAGPAEQLVAVRDNGQSRTPFTVAGRLLKIELRQHVGYWPPQPGVPRRGNDDVPVVRQRGESDVVVMRQHRDFVLRSIHVSLEQQILHRALQARHLLRQPFAAVFLRCTLGLGTW